MDQSRESLQTRIQALKDPSVRELVRDVVDSAWQWSRGQVGKQAQERWVIVGGQAVRGTTENEKAPPQNGGQSDGQGQTQPVAGAAGPAGPKGDPGINGLPGKDGADGKDGTKTAGVTGEPLGEITFFNPYA